MEFIITTVGKADEQAIFLLRNMMISDDAKAMEILLNRYKVQNAVGKALTIDGISEKSKL